MAELDGKRFHLLPIGGTGMASLAGLLLAAGARVTGSDGPLYPPMSEVLERLGIEPYLGFAPANLDRALAAGPIDRVVIGNAVPRSNPEVEEVLRRGLPYASMPETLRDLLLPGRHAIVVTGTHGKTSTSALMAWLLESSGRRPSFLVGGQLQNFGQNFQLGSGREFVIEGDEYNSAFFDRGPKFLHYRAETLLVNNVELDHVDLYPDLEAVLAAFRAAVARVPESGTVVWNADDEGATEVAAAPGPARRVSFSIRGREADWRGERDADGRVRLSGPGFDCSLHLPPALEGDHNLSNTLATVAIAAGLGLGVDDVVRGLESFRGVRRRLEVVGEAGGITVVDDFAHHPTAVRETIAAARRRFPERRMVVAFEPRSLSAAHDLFHDAYRQALATADLVRLVPPHHAARVDEASRLDVDHLVRELPHAEVAADPEALARALVATAAPGDVVLVMSSGAFGNLPRRLLELLAERSPSLVS